MDQQQRRSLIAAAAVTVLLLCLVILAALTTPVDRQVSNLFFDAVSGRWLVDHGSGHLRLWLYDGPKWLLMVFGIALAIAAIRPGLVPGGWFGRREALFLFACLAVVPLTVGIIKKQSGVHCPYTLQQYGGTQDDETGHVSLAGFFDDLPEGGCWPSGHASGGFALLALAWLQRSRRARFRLALPGLVFGLSMGAYQVARGAHFVSHVLVTGLISVLLILVLSVLFGIAGEVPVESR